MQKATVRGIRALSRCALVAALTGMAMATSGKAATYTESSDGELSDDRLSPTFLQLDYSAGGNVPGSNVVTGTVGRAAATGVTDRDYLRINVPAGYEFAELRVGNQTTVGGSGSFIGLATGTSMPIEPSASTAAGLLGWKIYTTADRNTDILDNLSIADNGSTGFARPLPSGDYTLWMQELATGTFTYRFNFVLSPVPEPSTWALVGMGLLLFGLASSRQRSRAGSRLRWES